MAEPRTRTITTVPVEELKAELEQAEAEGDDSPRCKNCSGELVKHGPENPHKAGAWHCNTCGACWAPGRREMREGHGAPDGWPKAD